MKNQYSHLDPEGLAHSLDLAKGYNFLNERSGYLLFHNAWFASCEVKKQAIVITDIRGRTFMMQMDSEN